MTLFGSSSERVESLEHEVRRHLDIIKCFPGLRRECWSYRELKKTKAHPLLDLKNLWEKSIEIQSNLPHKS